MGINPVIHSWPKCRESETWKHLVLNQVSLSNYHPQESGFYVEEHEEILLKPEIAGDTKDKASSVQNWNKKIRIHRDCEEFTNLVQGLARKEYLN